MTQPIERVKVTPRDRDQNEMWRHDGPTGSSMVVGAVRWQGRKFEPLDELNDHEDDFNVALKTAPIIVPFGFRQPVGAGPVD